MEIPIYDDKWNKTRDKLSFNPKWVESTEGLSLEAVEFTEAFGKYLVDPQWNSKYKVVRAGRDALTTNQLRNFFGEIRRIQLKGYKNNKADFIMLKPKLAYAMARITKERRNSRIKEFVEVLNALIDIVVKTSTEERLSQKKSKTPFNNFVKFVEATVAYHKAYGGN